MRGSNDCRLTKLVRDFLKVESNRVDSGSLNFNRFKFYNSKIKFVIVFVIFSLIFFLIIISFVFELFKFFRRK